MAATASPKASVPVKTTVAPAQVYEVQKDVVHEAFAQGKGSISSDELVGERETVADCCKQIAVRNGFFQVSKIRASHPGRLIFYSSG